MAKNDITKHSAGTQFSGANAVEMARRSHEARKQNIAERKLLKEQILERMKKKDWDEVIEGVIQRAKDTDKGFEVFRDTIGEKPVDKQEVDIREIPKISVVRKDG
jgi:hypothetical protein